MIHSPHARSYFLILSLAAAAILTALVFAPFLKPLALAAIFAVVLHGIFLRVSGWFHHRSPSVAAFLTVLFGVVVILLPLLSIGTLVANEARSLYATLASAGGGRTVVSQMILSADASYGTSIPGLSGFAENLSANIDDYTRQLLSWISSNATRLLSGVSSLVLSFFVFFVALYYLLRDGKLVRAKLFQLSPLHDDDDAKISDRLEAAINSVIKGNLTLALVQGVATAIGFTLCGVPSSILWGTVASVAALIPGIGTGLVIAPAVGYLFFIGAEPQAIVLLVWGVFAVGLVDNFIGPRLVGRGMNLHPLLVLLAVLGGLAYFGPSGIFLGPLSVILLFALLSIYTDVSRPAA